MATQEFDYIIVGAGSAGCVLANRLGEDKDVKILVLEAGGKDYSIYIHMPAALAEPLKTDTYNWYYESQPEPYMDNRVMYCPRGKVLGGSSSINGMLYIRGHALDYDRWGQALPGWSYADCLPYFRKAVNHELGADDYQGDSGPLNVSAGKMKNPLFQAWIEAGRQAGYPITEDVNGYQQEGIGRYDMTVKNGRRWSTAQAYLRPAMKRGNITVETRALTLNLDYEGSKVVGLTYKQGNDIKKVRASREVIVSSGAINSPQLLQLSGIGPAALLKEQGIEVKADLPGVGANLQDHIECYVQYQCTKPISLYPALKWYNHPWIGFQWLFFNKGIGASNQFEAGGFIRSRAGYEHPNLQFHFLPIAMNYDGSNPVQEHGFQCHVGPMRPTSRGHVKIRSNDPTKAPEILFNYNQTQQDIEEIRDGIRLTREIIEQQAFDQLRGAELMPGPAAQSDAEIDAFVRQHAESAYHPSCTNKMGAESDPMAVVNDQGQVYGVENLRVVDASIMPDIPSGNLNAPTIMIAEKMADRIKGANPLPRSDAKVWIHPDWENKQR
ncbi:choline dehydrogenase [Rhodovibrionaceae bacterium A322]